MKGAWTLPEGNIRKRKELGFLKNMFKDHGFKLKKHNGIEGFPLSRSDSGLSSIFIHAYKMTRDGENPCGVVVSATFGDAVSAPIHTVYSGEIGAEEHRVEEQFSKFLKKLGL